MSVVAETVQPIEHAGIDDRLARRNAMVLAVAQALGGANNIIIYSTASIVGAMIAPDRGLATLPITCTVIGMWLGTLPVGALARRFGRRVAVQTGSVFGVVSGLISYSAVVSGRFLAAARRHLLRRALRGLAAVLPFCRRRYGERILPPEGGVLGAGRRRIRRRARAADRHRHQEPDAALSVCRQLSRAGGGGGDRLRRARLRQGAAARRTRPPQARARCGRSCAAPASSWRSAAAWRAIR